MAGCDGAAKGQVLVRESRAVPNTIPERVGRGLEPIAIAVSGLGRERVAALTGLRGFAILIVFVSHCANAGYLPAWLGKGTGQLGVMLFFVLSGFLMASLYLPQAPDRAASIGYVLARLGRVAPLYLAVVALSVAVGPAVAGWPYGIGTPSIVAQHLAFLRADGALWAVPVEVQFYLVFYAVWRLSRRAGGLDAPAYLGLWAAVLAVCAPLAILYQLGGLAQAGLFYHLHYFVIGCLLPGIAPALKRGLDAVTARIGGLALSLVALGLLVACLPAVRRELGLSAPLWLDPAVALAITATFVLSLHRTGLLRVMEAPALTALGTISYGFYLLHPIVLGVHEAHFEDRSPLAVALVFAGSAAAATASWCWIERPALRWFKGFAPR